MLIPDGEETNVTIANIGEFASLLTKKLLVDNLAITMEVVKAAFQGMVPAHIRAKLTANGLQQVRNK